MRSWWASCGLGTHIPRKAGETLPADGTVVEGNSSVNESSPGEYRLAKGSGMQTGGSVNVASPLLLRVGVGNEAIRRRSTLMERAATENLVSSSSRTALPGVSSLPRCL